MRRLVMIAVMVLVATRAFAQQPAADEPARMEIYGFAMLDMGVNLKTINPNWTDTLRVNRLPSFDGQFGEDWRMTLNLVPLVMKAAVGVTPDVKVFGTDYDTPDGTAIRDYVHVIDLADAHVRAIDHLERGGESTVVNLGTGQGSSVFEVIDVAGRVSGREIPVEKLGRRAGDPVAVYADLRRAQDVLGWTPQFGIDEIIESAWKWHSSHPDGYEG